MTIETAAPAHIDVDTLQRWSAADREFKLLDVRTPAEFETAHIPGSYNVPLALLDEHRAELRNHLHEPVILICRSGKRAGQAEQLLAESGMSNLLVLEGGMLAWESTGAAVRRGRQRWELERQVRLVAGLLVLGGVLGSVFFEPAKWLAGLVGAGLTFAALSNSCTMGMLLARLPYNRAPACDVADAVARLIGPTESRSR